MARASASSQDITGRLAHMSRLVHDRLDNVSKALPPQPETEPFEAYMARAASRAEYDPVFKEQFERAVKTYKALGG